MKEFTSSARARNQDDVNLVDLPFNLDGQDYTLRAPKRTQLAFLTASAAASRTSTDRIAAILDFVEAGLLPPGDEILRRRLLDPDDPLELDTVVDIISWAMEEWTGRPSTSANGSSPRPLAGGRRSRATASDADSRRSR